MSKKNNDEWQKLIAECNESGKTQTEWCKTKNINLHTFRDRKSRMQQADKKMLTKTERPKVEEKVEWLPVMLEQSSEQEISWKELSVKIGEFTIIAETDFNESTFKRVCKALKELC